MGHTLSYRHIEGKLHKDEAKTQREIKKRLDDERKDGNVAEGLTPITQESIEAER